METLMAVREVSEAAAEAVLDWGMMAIHAATAATGASVGVAVAASNRTLSDAEAVSETQVNLEA
jgi:hypothetical protein